MNGTASGWALLISAGAANATFSLPMKFVRRWKWENTWAVWTLLALVALPATLAFTFVPSLPAVYGGENMRVAAIVCFFGVGWGFAQVLFGRAIDSIGIGLAFSIVLGISSAGGTLLPLVQQRARGSASSVLPGLAVGLVLIALGVTTCAIAGHLRESAQLARVARQAAFTPGLIMAVVSGLLASLMNVGIAFANPLLLRASAQGLGPTRTMYTVWLPLLLGGAVPNLLYCAHLQRRNGTFSLYRGPGQLRNLVLAAVMAVLWFFSTALYGLATQWLGGLGVVLGWPVFMSVIVIAAGLLGFLSGEWVHAGKTSVLFQVAGIALLVFAIVAIARAQASRQDQSNQAVSRRINLEAHVR